MDGFGRSLLRIRRRLKYSSLAFLFYRYRYLIAFTIFGFLSILIELAVLLSVIPENWPTFIKTGLSFAVGLVVSYVLNAQFNFRVPERYFVSTFCRFAIVSCASFAINALVMRLARSELGVDYATSRLICAGILFLIAYTLHRRLTFRLDRNFGIAVYASPTEQVRRIFLKVGRNCDHIHVDLVDQTIDPKAEVDLGKIALARKLWPEVPFAIHLMTRRPDKWLDESIQHIDWILFSLSSDVPLLPLIARCQLRGKKVGVVWHVSDSLAALYEFMPHVDFIMVLGIAKPGASGQTITPESLEVITMLDRIHKLYHFELMFDGSVNTETITSIPARYIVAASSVLRSKQPARVIYTLKTGARHERNAA